MIFTVYINLVLEEIQAGGRTGSRAWEEYAASRQAESATGAGVRVHQPAVVGNHRFRLRLQPGYHLVAGALVAVVLFNPGGFRKEFYSLRLPRALLLPTLLGLCALLLMPDNAPVLVRDLVILMLILYLYQGLSVIHGFVHARTLSRVWLTGMYLTFFLLPHVILVFVSCLGIVNRVP